MWRRDLPRFALMAVLLVAWIVWVQRASTPVSDTGDETYDAAYALLGEALHTAGGAAKRELLERSLEALTEVLEAHPDDVSTYVNRGNVYAELGMYPEAVADYSVAIRLAPEAVDALKNRGLAFERWGRYEDALRDYESFLARIGAMGTERRREEFAEFSGRVERLRAILHPAP